MVMVEEIDVDGVEYLEVMVGATSVSMHDRFTLLAETSPFQGAPRRARRLSTNDGPLLSSNLRSLNRDEIVDEVVQQLGLDWRVQELQQDNRSRAGSRPPSRASSLSRHGSETYLPGLVRTNSWGNLSRSNSIGNISQRSGYSGRSNGGRSDCSRFVSLKPDLNQRLRMRDAWLRARRLRGRGRGRGRGGNVQRNQYQQRQFGRWGNRQWGGQQWGGRQWGGQQWGGRQWGGQQWRGRQWGGQRWGARQWGGQQWGRQQQRGWGRLRRWGYAQSERPALTPRGRAGLETPGASNEGRGAGGRGRGRGRGRGAGPATGVSQSSMPPLTTLEQLDRELEEYMASAPASLDKELEEYMAQTGLAMDTDD